MKYPDLTNYVASFLIPLALLTQTGCPGAKAVDTAGIEQAVEDANGALEDGFFSWSSKSANQSTQPKKQKHTETFSDNELKTLDSAIKETRDTYSGKIIFLNLDEDPLQKFYNGRPVLRRIRFDGKNRLDTLGVKWYFWNMPEYTNKEACLKLQGDIGRDLYMRPLLSGNEEKFIFYLLHSIPKEETKGVTMRLLIGNRIVRNKDLDSTFIKTVLSGSDAMSFYVDKLTLTSKLFEPFREEQSSISFEVLHKDLEGNSRILFKDTATRY